MTVPRDDRPRSLERKRLYTIFAPLDPNEPLPREILHEATRFRMFGPEVPPDEDAVGRMELAGLLWLPALGLVLLLSVWANVGALGTLVAVAMLLAGLWRFAGSGEYKSR
jgi:hypothetical protein